MEAKRLFSSLRSDEQISIYVAGRMTRRVYALEWMSEIAAADIPAFVRTMHATPCAYRGDLFLVLGRTPPDAKEKIAKDASLLLMIEGMADDNMSISIVNEIRSLAKQR